MASQWLPAGGLRPHHVRGKGIRTFAGPGLAETDPAPSGALFLDRQARLVRTICARRSPVDDFRVIRRSLDRLRGAGTRIGVASHNRADSWETFDVAEIGAMHDRLEAALGPIDLWCVCLVDRSGHCACGMPGDGLLAGGAEAVGLTVDDCAVASDDGRLAAAASEIGAANLLDPAMEAELSLARAAEAIVR